jgi:superfamily II DNA helicase RecQ
MQKDSKCMHFLVCLHFSIIHSLYSDVNLKPKQVICLEKIFLGEDILAILPTGYGKSLIYQLLPLILFRKKVFEEDPNRGIISIGDVTTVLLVISPLNSLISDQIRKLLTTGLRVSSLNASQRPQLMTTRSLMLISMARRKNLPVVIITYYSPILRHSSRVNLDENWLTVQDIKKMSAPL